MNNQHIDLLLQFLNTTIDNSDKIFECFSKLPNAVYNHSSNPFERYVFIPGTRKDRVVLVAHADTIWDKNYTAAEIENHTVIFENGIFKSSNPNWGIGADDRAGCAMLWALKDSGHSILITDGEERGKFGANYLKNKNRKLFRLLNRHRYMIELDWQGTNCSLFNQVDNTKKFKKYIENDLGFIDSKLSGGTDLAILCRNICGVNLGVGYHNHHTNKEFLVLSEWENTLTMLSEFLAKPQPKFYSLILPPYIRFLRRCVSKLLRILKLKK